MTARMIVETGVTKLDVVGSTFTIFSFFVCRATVGLVSCLLLLMK